MINTPTDSIISYERRACTEFEDEILRFTNSQESEVGTLCCKDGEKLNIKLWGAQHGGEEALKALIGSMSMLSFQVKVHKYRCRAFFLASIIVTIATVILFNFGFLFGGIATATGAFILIGLGLKKYKQTSWAKNLFKDQEKHKNLILEDFGLQAVLRAQQELMQGPQRKQFKNDLLYKAEKIVFDKWKVENSQKLALAIARRYQGAFASQECQDYFIEIQTEFKQLQENARQDSKTEQEESSLEVTESKPQSIELVLVKEIVPEEESSDKAEQAQEELKDSVLSDYKNEAPPVESSLNKTSSTNATDVDKVVKFKQRKVEKHKRKKLERGLKASAKLCSKARQKIKK